MSPCPSFGKVTQLALAPFTNEKELQKFVKANLEELLGVRRYRVPNR